MLILGLIILVDIIALAYVMRIGIRHDAFHDVSTVEQSAAVKRLYERYGSPKAAQAAVNTLKTTGDVKTAVEVGDAVEATEAEIAAEAVAESEDTPPTSAG
jgi:hypothetical protein